jgi:hypothetical protein
MQPYFVEPDVSLLPDVLLDSPVVDFDVPEPLLLELPELLLPMFRWVSDAAPWIFSPPLSISLPAPFMVLQAPRPNASMSMQAIVINFFMILFSSRSD